MQGLRGIAVLVVVLFHAGLGFRGGFVGVDVFFVISGFVIARGLLDEADREGTVDLRRFYARRVRRLLPALATMLTVVAAACIVVLAPAFHQPNALRTALAAGLSVSNLFLWKEGGGYFTPLDEGNPFVHTWSLGVEEQFYLFFPLFVFVCWRLARRRPIRRSGRSTFVVLLACASLASLALSIALTYELEPFAGLVPQPARFAFYGPVTRVWEFAAGALVAVFRTRRAGPSSAARGRRSAVLGAVGVALIVASTLVFDSRTAFPGIAAAVPVAGSALAVAYGDGGMSRVLGVRPLTWIGDRSYSWYLWHWPFIVLGPALLPDAPAVAPIAAALSLVPAMASYRLVEQRFRVTADSPRRITAPRVAAVSVVLPLLLVGGALRGANRGWGLPNHPELSSPTAAMTYACATWAMQLDQCTFGSASAPEELMLVGDSHADVLADALVDAAGDRYRVIVQTNAGCAFGLQDLAHDTEAISALTSTADCAARQERTLRLIEEVQPSVLFIANRSPLVVMDTDGDPYATPDGQRISAWEDALTTTLTHVAPLTGRVVLFAVPPYFSIAEFDRALPTVLRPEGTRPTAAIEDVQRSRQPILYAERRAADTAGVPYTIVDPVPYLCEAGLCPVRADDGHFLFRDNNHLSNPGAARLVERLRAVLAD